MAVIYATRVGRALTLAAFAFLSAVSGYADDSSGSKNPTSRDRLAEVTVSDQADLAVEAIGDAPDPPSTYAANAVAKNTQPQPPLTPPMAVQPTTPAPLSAADVSRRLFGAGDVSRSALSESRRGRGIGPSTDIVLGLEARTRVTTDAGSLLRKSGTTLGVGVQQRTPIVNDPRIRGDRVGALAASGSYWVPARIDLDTVLSKVDSRIVEDMIVVKGPYSVLYGPGFNFVDVELLRSPRSTPFSGSTSLDYRTNGEQWYGRQSASSGSDDGGYRISYGERSGSDYHSGNGTKVPSGYHSRDWDVAFGYDLSVDSHVEFNYLRLDQTDVEFPGQAFDMDYLVTDGFDLEYERENHPYFDRVTVDSWYNRTRFEGNAQGAGKRAQFPILDFINYTGFTDVDAASTGFRAAFTWGNEEDGQLTAGTDLRHIKQELNEIGSGQIGFNIWQDANSPLPRSESVNPGLLAELTKPVNERLRIKTGIRGDLVSTDVIEDPAKLVALGNQNPASQSSLGAILGSNEFDETFSLWSAYLTSDFKFDSCWTLTGGVGYAQRPPTLTELYVAQPFLFLLQNGLNTATGDPRLAPEQLYQIDLGIRGEYGSLRGGLKGFHAWINDYITFENIGVVSGPPTGDVQQVNLKYVNTDLATLAGGEVYGEWDTSSWATAFATVTYVEGRDHTRNGHFATRPATPGVASLRAPGLPRGFFSGVTGDEQEPLPSILPLECRVGIRLHESNEQPRWGFEFSARIVDNQDRVAASLLETSTPGFTVLDIRSYWQLTSCLYFVAGIENIGNRNFREHLDFRSLDGGLQIFRPGVNGYFGAELTY